MTIDYPGSTEVVSWKDNLPDWIELTESMGLEVVAVEMTDDVESMIDRYNTNEICEIVIDRVFEANMEFDGLSFEESMEKAVEHMRYENLATLTIEVEEEL